MSFAYSKLPFKLIKGILLYHVNQDLLRIMYDNKNIVLLLSDETEPYKPKYYMRYCDFIDMVSLKRAGLVETSNSIWDLSEFPEMQHYYQNRAFAELLDYNNGELTLKEQITKQNHILHEEGTEEYDVEDIEHNNRIDIGEL